MNTLLDPGRRDFLLKSTLASGGLVLGFYLDAACSATIRASWTTISLMPSPLATRNARRRISCATHCRRSVITRMRC